MDETAARDGAGRFSADGLPFFDPRRDWWRVATMAVAQHGVATSGQLVGIGLSARTVRDYARTGRLHRIHHGVYGLAPRELLKLNGLRMAAVLAFGEQAALSHRSAGALLGLIKAEGGPFEVSVPSRAGRPQRPGLRIHRTATLRLDEDVTVIDGIPCTTAARTLIDLAERESAHRLERALDQAEALRLLDLDEFREQIEHNHGRIAAAGRFKRALAIHLPGTTATWTEIEERFLTLIRAAGVPRPQVQAYLDLQDGEPMIRPDFLWRDQGVIVETDGWQHHGSRLSFEADRRRDQRAAAAGFTTLRVTWRQIQSEQERLQRTVASAVSAGAAATWATAWAA
jgi:predicted transcriptional regulator of viral defense system